MTSHRPDVRSLSSWPRALGIAFLYVAVASPAAPCTFINAEAAILASIAEAEFYWIGTALLVTAILVLDFLEKRWSVDFALGVAIVAFHPAWTISPWFYPDCTFENVDTSQWAAVLLTSALILRVFRYHRRRKAGVPIGASQ